MTTRSRGKKTRELPNLTECHCCHLRVDLAKSNKQQQLHILYSEWRIVLLCHKCLARVQSTELCSFCFNDSSFDSFSCQSCNRRVHKDCDSDHRSPGVSELSVCGDCWVSESLARWRRSRNAGGARKMNTRPDLGSRVCDDPSVVAVCDSSTEPSRLEVVEEEEEEEQEQENVDDDDDDDDVALKEGQGSCSNGVGVESPACSEQEDCNCVIRPNAENRNGRLDPYYFKYRRRRRRSSDDDDQTVLTYKRRSVAVDCCCKSLLRNVECPVLTYRRRGIVDTRFMFTYKRRRNFEQAMLTYERRRPGILYASSEMQLEVSGAES